mgnify:FL=1
MPSKSHALGRTNHQRWLRLRGIGQRSDLSELAVLAAQFFNRTELNGALRTGLHADGLQTGFETVKTAVALAHLLGDRIEDRCMVRASHGASAAADALESAQSLWGQAHRVKAATVDLNAVLKAYQALQGREIWKHDGTFIEKYQPTFGPGVKERFAFAKTVHDKDLTEQESLCEQAVRHIYGLLADSSVLILPTLPGAGLKLDCSPDDMNAFRSKMSASFCLGGLAGVPWITLPLAEIDGAPLGVSLVSACDTDAWLLELSKALVQNR